MFLLVITIKRGAVHYRGTYFNGLYEYEQYISELLEHNTKQTKITNLFHE